MSEQVPISPPLLATHITHTWTHAHTHTHTHTGALLYAQYAFCGLFQTANWANLPWVTPVNDDCITIFCLIISNYMVNLFFFCHSRDVDFFWPPFFNKHMPKGEQYAFSFAKLLLSWPVLPDYSCAYHVEELCLLIIVKLLLLLVSVSVLNVPGNLFFIIVIIIWWVERGIFGCLTWNSS